MNYIVSDLSVILISTATLCFLAELAKQPLIVAYIFAGIIVGPLGLNLIVGNGFFSALSQAGIVLLLFLIGLQLKPQKFAETIRKSYKIAICSILGITPLMCFIGWVSGLSSNQIVFLGIASLFSSTVVVLKTIHDQRGVDADVEETCVGILLIQDVMAILSILILSSLSANGGFNLVNALSFVMTGALFVIGIFAAQTLVLRHVLHKIIDRIDLVLLIGLAWCFLSAEIAETIHLSREIGGFLAGLSLTALPARKQHVFASKSGTIRDFFMILFFFVLGANLRFEVLKDYSLLIMLSLVAIICIKPLVFYAAARHTRHNKGDSKQIGVRMGQNSEFSVILAAAAVSTGYIDAPFAMAIQVILFLSIIASNYLVKYVPQK